MDLPIRFGARLGQRVKKARPIRVILEDAFAPVAAIQDLINRARILDSEFAGHAEDLPKRAEGINMKFYNDRD